MSLIINQMSEKKISEYNIMNKKNLKKISKSKLIEIMLKLEKKVTELEKKGFKIREKEA